MRIGFLSSYHLQGGGGIEHWLVEVAGRLSRRHWVGVLANRRGLLVQRVEDLLADVWFERVDFSWGHLPFTRGFAEMSRFFSWCDVVYLFHNIWPSRIGLGMSFAPALLQEVHDTPVILGHRMVFDPFVSGFSLFTPLAFKIGGMFKAHHVLNRYTEHILRRLSFGWVFRVPNGVDTAFFRPRVKREKFTLLFLGRLAKQKGLERIAGLVAGLSGRGVDFELLVAGAGPVPEHLREVFGSSKVRWLGFVDGPPKAELYATSHLFVSPSTMETFMNTGLEAMASGTPVVAMDNIGVREYVVDGRNGFIVGSVEEMVARIAEVYDSWRKTTDLYDSLCVGARATAEAFSWEKVMVLVEEMFEQARKL